MLTWVQIKRAGEKNPWKIDEVNEKGVRLLQCVAANIFLVWNSLFCHPQNISSNGWETSILGHNRVHTFFQPPIKDV